MKIKTFIQLRDKAVEAFQSITSDFVPLVKATDTINVPFDVEGTPMEVAKQVPYEHHYTPFRSISAEFLRSIGAYGAIPTFRNNINEVLESLTPSQVEKIFNPAPVEQSNENK